MADTTITGLPIAATIDATQDWLAIDTTYLATTQKINRNTFLGITSGPLGITDSQSPTNKTFNNTNIFTVRDDRFTLQDNSDTTKQLQLQLSGITTGTTRTLTAPDRSSTIATLGGDQTFTGANSFTGSSWTGGTISNSTISVNAISEFTSANGVTVDGLNLKDGKLNTNDSVVTANITDSAVTPAKLLTGTGSSWVWQTWTPTWTNLTVGNGTTSYLYAQTGKTVHFRMIVTFGSTSAMGTNPNFTPPVTPRSNYNLRQAIGIVSIEDAGTASFFGFVRISDSATTLVQPSVASAGGTYVGYQSLSSTIPMTWAIGDQLMIVGTYEAA